MIDPSKYKVYYSCCNSSNFFELNGIESVSVQKNISHDQRFLLGGVDSAYSINAPEEVEISFDRSFINCDSIFEYTGSNPVDEFRIYNGSSFFSIRKAYLKNYSASFSVGDLPKINTNFSSYGSSINQIEFFDGGSVSQHQLDIPKLNAITLSGIHNQSLKSKYNIFSFSYNLTVNRQPYYSVGQKEPTEVCPILPLQIQASISSRIPNTLKKIDIPELEDSFADFDIVVSGSNSNFILPMRKSKLVGSNILITSQNTIEIKKDFLGYYGL